MINHRINALGRITLLITFNLSLVACGGGSSGGSVVDTTGGGVVDTTAPTVSSTTPAASATAVARNSVITATFDEDIFATTVAASSFTLARSGNIDGTVTFDGVANVATFTPSNDLSILLATYSATLSTEITDLSGNPLATDYSWSFTSADGAWQSAAGIEAGAESAIDPQIAINSSGNAVAVWTQRDGSSNNVFSNRYDASTGVWGAVAEQIETVVGFSELPQIAIDSSGNALAVWPRFNDSDIHSKRYDASTGAWGATVLIDTGAGPAKKPQIAIDSNGNALAVWQQFNGSEFSIYSNRYDASAGVWGTAVLIESSSEGASATAQIAIDSSGNAVAVWAQSDGVVSSSVYSNRYDVSTGLWGAAVLIEHGVGVAGAPQIAIDSSGNALAVWPQHDGIADSVYSNRYDASTGLWGTEEPIKTTTGAAATPQIAVDSNGNALAVWQQLIGTEFSIYSNRYDASTGAWGTATVRIETGTGVASTPQITIDSIGNALAVWTQHDGTADSIYSNRYDASTGVWGTSAVQIETGVGAAGVPQVAIDGSGKALAVWFQNDGITLSIYSNRFE